MLAIKGTPCRPVESPAEQWVVGSAVDVGRLNNACLACYQRRRDVFVVYRRRSVREKWFRERFASRDERTADVAGRERSGKNEVSLLPPRRIYIFTVNRAVYRAN